MDTGTAETADTPERISTGFRTLISIPQCVLSSTWEADPTRLAGCLPVYRLCLPQNPSEPHGPDAHKQNAPEMFES